MITFRRRALLMLGIISSLLLVAEAKFLGVKIYPELPQITMTTKETRTFTCNFEGEAGSMITNIRWTGPNRIDNAEELKQRGRVNEERSATTIDFNHPAVDDSGIYYCFGTFQSTDSYNASIKVKITTPIEFKNCNERQFLLKGSRDAKIYCAVTAEQLKASIYKDDKSVNSGSRYVWDTADSISVIGEVDQSDAGVYRAKVLSLSDGSSLSRDIRVEVHSKPEIAPYNGTDSDSEYHGVEGQPATLECKVTGVPRPIVYWLDPNLRNLTTVEGYSIDLLSGTLKIHKVNRLNDRGFFQCYAINTVGSVSRQVSMAVDVKPTIVSFFNVTTLEGQEATFECRATGEPMPKFSIRRVGNNQTDLSLGDGFVRDISTDPEGGGSDVYVYRVKIIPNRLQFDKYICNATNRAGSVELFNHLIVEHKPDITGTPSEQYVTKGKPFIITCLVKAYPRPTITWYSNGAEIFNVNSNVTVFNQVHVATMMPPPQTPFSKITCYAKNVHGDASFDIIPRYTTAPGEVYAQLLETTPTTVKLQLNVPNDGGTRVKFYEYKLEGRTLDIHNPFHQNRIDKRDGTIIVSSPNPSSTYTIRNLFPFYRYTLNIRAVNEVGPGDIRDLPVETLKAKSPEPPIITKPKDLITQHTTSGTLSDYRNGYLLKWSPPELDNGEPVTKYIISYNKVVEDTIGSYKDVTPIKVLDHMSGSQLHARLGPLEPNQRYKIQVQAVNKHGESLPDYIVITAREDRPSMPEFEPLTWSKESVTYIVLIVVAICILVFLDLICCYSFQLGLTYKIRYWCCPVDSANSVLGDKPPPAQP